MSVRALVACVVIVALSAAIGVTTGLYGGSYNLRLVFLLGLMLRLFSGRRLQVGPQTGMVAVFWLNVLLYSIPAYGLFLVGTRLRNWFPVCLVLWTAIYLWVFVFSGNLIDMP